MVNPFKDALLVTKLSLLDQKSLIYLAYGLWKVCEANGMTRDDLEGMISRVKKTGSMSKEELEVARKEGL